MRPAITNDCIHHGPLRRGETFQLMAVANGKRESEYFCVYCLADFLRLNVGELTEHAAPVKTAEPLKEPPAEPSPT